MSPPRGGRISWSSLVMVGAAAYGLVRFLSSKSVWLLLLQAFDAERDGDIEVFEVLGVVTGKAFALLYVATLQLHRYASILFVVACFCVIWVTVTSIISAWKSRLFVTFHVDASDDLLEPLRFFCMNAQLPHSRRLEANGARFIDRGLVGAQLSPSSSPSGLSRFIPRQSVKTWQTSSDQQGGELKEYFEVCVDPRYREALFAFDPRTGELVAAGQGVSPWGKLCDALCYMFLRRGPRR